MTRLRILLAACVFPVALSGCVDVSGSDTRAKVQGGVRFLDTPEPQGRATVTLDRSMTINSVAARLKEAGYKSTSVDAGRRIVQGTTDRRDLVDCGRISQRVLGNNSTFDGTAPFSVIYTSQAPLELISREVDVRTVVRVKVDGNVALVDDTHTVSIEWVNLDSGRVRRETRTVGPGSIVRFSDGTTCSSSTRAAAELF